MKKIIFTLIFTIMNQFVFPQSDVMQFHSLGFNATETSGGSRYYYFYGFKDYSEAFIFDSHIRLSTGEPRTFYPIGLITYRFPPNEYIPYNGQNNSIGYEHSLPTIGFFGEEHKFENGRLVYWALSEGRRPYATAERIEQNDQSIILYIKNGERNSTDRYFNISQIELLDIF